MRQQNLIEMHEFLKRILREMDESGQQGFEIQSMVRGMSDQIQKMIESFAKLAGDAMINLRAAVMSHQGDEGAMQVEHGLTHAVNQAADALARLKMELDALVDKLGMGGMGTGMGSGMGGMGMGGGMDGDPTMGGAGMDPSMQGGDMGAPGMEAGGMPPDASGMPAGPDMGAAPTPEVPGGQVQPERARKKA